MVGAAEMGQEPTCTIGCRLRQTASITFPVMEEGKCREPLCNVEIQQNHGQGAPDVSLVTVGGNLICLLNSSAPTHVHGPSWVDGNSIGQCNKGFATTTTQIDLPVSPAESCAALAHLPATGFPVPNTVITSAVDAAAGGGLPERCHRQWLRQQACQPG